MTESTEVAVRQPTQVTTGGEVAGLIPQSIEEAYRLATAISKSGLAPKSMDSAEKCLVAIMAGAEIGLAPFQAVQGFAVIGSRPVLWGDAMLAVVLKNGFIVREGLEGDGDDMEAWCEVTRPDNKNVIRRTFSVADAKKAKLWSKDGPWQTNGKRMLSMRARAFACRDGAADVLKGFSMREEVADYEVIREARPQVSDLRERLEANKAPALEGFTVENGAHEPETAEEVLAEVELPVTNNEPEEILGMEVVADADVPPNEARFVSGGKVIGTITNIAEPEPPASEAPAPATDPSALNRAIDAYLERLAAASTTIKLRSLREANRRLLDSLSDERQQAIDNIWNQRWAEIEGQQ